MVEVESSSLSVQARKVYRLFVAACDKKSAAGSKDGRELQDTFERFRLWAGNVGAFQNDTRSLDHRTRNALLVRNRLLELLTELEDLLHQHSNNSSERRLPEIDEEPSNAQSTTEQESVSQRDAALLAELEGFITSQECQSSWISSGIADIITRLFKMSAQLAKSTVTDRYAKAEAARGAKLPSNYDIAHVKEKFRDSTGESWLMERLGMAITKRRQYLIYCQKHRERLAKEPPIIQPINNLPEVAIIRATPTESRSAVISRHTKDTRPSALPTTASTLVPAMAEVVDDGFDDAKSVYTVATSISFSNDKNALRVPALTEFARPGEYFECPYCRTMRRFNGQRSWKQHVFADIRPYLCTFADCGLLMFDSRRAWIDHELQQHRRQWSCQLCDKNGFKDQLNLQSHLSNAHPGSQNIEMLSYMQQTVPLEMVASKDCFLCDWNSILHQQNPHAKANEEMSVTILQLMNHLAKHLEQLALFALPRVVEDESAASLQVAGSRETYQDLSSISTVNLSSKRDEVMWSAETIAQIRTMRSRLIAFKHFNDMLKKLRGRKNAIGTAFKISSWHALKVKLLVYARFNTILTLLRQDVGVLQTVRRVFDGRLPDGFLLWSAASRTYPSQTNQDVKLRILDEREHLAAFCHKTKRWSKAQEVESAILSSRLEVYGPRHHSTIDCSSRMGEALHQLGMYNQELDLHLKLAVLTMREIGWENEEAEQSMKRLVACSIRLAHSPWSSLTVFTAEFEVYFLNSLEICLKGLSKELRISVSAAIACSFYNNGDPARGELLITTLTDSQPKVVRKLLEARSQAIRDMSWLSQTEVERAARDRVVQGCLAALSHQPLATEAQHHAIIRVQNDILELLNNPQLGIAEREIRRVPFRAILQPDAITVDHTPETESSLNLAYTELNPATAPKNDQNLIADESMQDVQEADFEHSVNARSWLCAMDECEFYTRGFLTRTQAEQHQATHFRGTLLCTYCANGSYVSFHRVGELKRHLAVEHGIFETDRPAIKSIHSLPANAEVSKGLCCMCGFVFESEDFVNHLVGCVSEHVARNVATDGRLETSTLDDAQVCTDCRTVHVSPLNALMCKNELSVYTKDVRRRSQEETGIFRCEQCQSGFVTSKLRDAHEQEDHFQWQCLGLQRCHKSIENAMYSSFMLWTCWYCGSSFLKEKEAIMNHLQQIHKIEFCTKTMEPCRGLSLMKRHAIDDHAAIDGPHLELLKTEYAAQAALTARTTTLHNRSMSSHYGHFDGDELVPEGARAPSRAPQSYHMIDESDKPSMASSLPIPTTGPAITPPATSFITPTYLEQRPAVLDMDMAGDQSLQQEYDHTKGHGSIKQHYSAMGYVPLSYPQQAPAFSNPWSPTSPQDQMSPKTTQSDLKVDLRDDESNTDPRLNYHQTFNRVALNASVNHDANAVALDLMKVIRQEIQHLNKATEYFERTSIQYVLKDSITKLLANSAIVQRRSPQYLHYLETLDEDMTSHDFCTNPLEKEAAWEKLTRKVRELLDGSIMNDSFITQHTQALLRILEYYRSNLKDMDQHDGSNAVVSMPEMNDDGIEFSSRATLLSNKTIDETRFLPEDFHHRRPLKDETRSQSQTAIKTLHGYILRPVSRESGLDDDWASSTVVKTLDTYDKLEQMASEHRRNGALPAQMLAEMLPHSREAVIKLLADARHKETYPLAKWSLYDVACFKKDVSRSMFRTDRITVGLHVILSRDVDYNSKPLVTSTAVDQTEPILLSLDNQQTSIVSSSKLEGKRRGLKDMKDGRDTGYAYYSHPASDSDVSSSDEIFVPVVSLKDASFNQSETIETDNEDFKRNGNQNKDGSWSCAYPGCTSRATFVRASDLRRHYKRHTKSFFCRYEDCPQATVGGFSSKKDRLRHEAKHNPMIKCEEEGCNRIFSRMDNMRDHVRRVHQKQKSTVSSRTIE